ncbi:hypothetical protein ACSRUE_20140 [Sorangium sp. KYC3313]|uniref:DUF7919 family protein n=1 Tax=Sorangium sp. KYC3313 TaxID=3449740 RepID=UPI003F8BB11E
MSYYRDGGHRWESYEHPKLITIGWMDAPRPIPQGTVDPEDFARLEQLIVHGWTPEEMEGTHACTFCFGDPDVEPPERIVAGRYTRLGGAQVGVPGKTCIYIFPDAILHYIDTHGYKPPKNFLRAVRKIDPKDPAYRQRCDELWTLVDWRHAASK